MLKVALKRDFEVEQARSDRLKHKLRDFDPQDDRHMAEIAPEESPSRQHEVIDATNEEPEDAHKYKEGGEADLDQR